MLPFLCQTAYTKDTISSCHGALRRVMVVLKTKLRVDSSEKKKSQLYQQEIRRKDYGPTQKSPTKITPLFSIIRLRKTRAAMVDL